MIALLPNFGAEEGNDNADLSRPEMAARARQWLQLFPSTACVIGLPDRSPYGGPAFPWLPEDGGIPWLSTEGAARRIARLGLRLAAPAPELVRKVHDKAFALRTAGDPWATVLEPDELTSERVRELIERLPAWLPGATLKPRWGSSGRGRIALGRNGPIPPLARMAARGGAIFEPWFDRVMDLSTLFHVGDTVELLGTTRQVISPSGVWQGNRGLVDRQGRPWSGTGWDPAIHAAALRVAEAAAAEGFRGPCGVDAFTFRAPDGERLRAVVEFNARTTMGVIAAGLLRRAAEEGRLDEAFFFGDSLVLGASLEALQPTSRSPGESGPPTS